uniref:Gametogenetin-binding protein 2 n=1 Tax=Clastoptera arizonana TaxID=38151 RepID=A0A1B6DI37_9HEMI
MAKLVNIYRNDKKQKKLGRRQLPLVVDENLTMIMDLNSMGFVYDNPTVRGKELDEFLYKFNLLSDEEALEAFQINCKDILSSMSQTIPCVGCRRSVERLFYQLMKSGHPALDPLVITSDGVLTIQLDHFGWPHLLCTLLHGHSSRLNDLVDSQFRSKKSRRCMLHSLDSQRTRVLTTAWREVWAVMRPQCRNEVVLIEASTLMATLENYLRKHRFCGECRTKVLRAYALLMEEPDPNQEKGYVPALYAGIKRCLPDKHIHLQTKTEYISNLITRAEPELLGSRRERHAKTLEIAQEEVLTCLGICVYERLHRIQLRLREEECTCQVLAAIAIDALYRKFEMAVEIKLGITKLEMLYEEITKEEKLKQQRKEHKKLKRRKRKEKKAGQEEKENYDCDYEEQLETECDHLEDSCTCFEDKPPTHQTDRQKLQVLDRKTKGSPTCYCADCLREKNKKSVVTMNNISVDNELGKQIILRGGVKCDSGGEDRNSIELSSIARSAENKQSSLSPCPSCVNAQELLNGRNNNIAWSSSDHSQDCGYSSENNLGSSSPSGPSSPEGSEIACSDGFCNHEGDCQFENSSDKNENLRPLQAPLSLQQMLEQSCSSDEEGYIPLEEVQEFKAQFHHLSEARQELRQILKKRFALLCSNGPPMRQFHNDH